MGAYRCGSFLACRDVAKSELLEDQTLFGLELTKFRLCGTTTGRICKIEPKKTRFDWQGEQVIILAYAQNLTYMEAGKRHSSLLPFSRGNTYNVVHLWEVTIRKPQALHSVVT